MQLISVMDWSISLHNKNGHVPFEQFCLEFCFSDKVQWKVISRYFFVQPQYLLQLTLVNKLS